MAGRLRRGMTFEEARAARLEAEIEELRRQVEQLSQGQARGSPRASVPPLEEEEEVNPFEGESEGEEAARRSPLQGARAGRGVHGQGRNVQFPGRTRFGDERQGRGREQSPRRGTNVRLDIPEFEGRMDPDEYLDWLHTIERVFEYEEVPEERRVKVAALRMRRYASLWWDNYNLQRRREGKERVRTWDKMKRALNKKFLPERYRLDLFAKLNSVRQETTVMAYTREFELLMLQCDIQEPMEQTVARYLRGLKPQVADAVELQPYWSFSDVCNLAHKVERQMARRASFPRVPLGRGPTFNKGSSSPCFGRQNANTPWAAKREVGGPSREKGKEVVKPPEKETQRRCFKCQGFGHFAYECPTRRTITLKEVLENDGLEEEENLMDEPLWDESEEMVEEPDEGELLVLRKVLNMNVGEEESGQRENIFQTRCTIQGKVCHVIVDGGSCTNVASTTMVDKLKLPTTVHPKPYKLHWLNKESDVRVTKQAKVELSIGRSYKDAVLCDVVPMDSCHLLLGRP